MKTLIFIHQNLPGQFIHLMRHFSKRDDMKLFGIGMAENIRTKSHANLTILGYPKPRANNKGTHHYAHFFERSILYGQTVLRVLLELKDKGVKPDLILAHPSWGEALFIRDAFPHTPIILYNEFFDHLPNPVFNFDPEFEDSFDNILTARARTATQLISQQEADAGISPTYWQRNFFPDFVQHKTRVIFDGIDSVNVAPATEPLQLKLPSITLDSRQEIITYLSRNLEPHRGFHRFMRALPQIQKQRPNAYTVIVGNDDVSYSSKPKKHDNWRSAMLAELGDSIDLSRVFFFPKLPYDDYLKVLKLSQVHIYLTYPSVLSWSMMEAMSSGCLIIASDTAPVTEVISHQENGLLIDFFNQDALIESINQVFEHPDRMAAIRRQARATICNNYDLEKVCLPQQIALLQTLVPGL